MAAGFKLVSRRGDTLKDKYRPQKLSEVVATTTISRLKKIITDKTGPRVFLFHGITGTGKTTCARILARALICSAATGDKPCLECDQCMSMESCGDFVELNIANQRGIDDMRQLIDEMRISPIMLNKRIYILDEVHQLSHHAQQILLKVLEEPPANVMIIMCTTDHKKLNRMLISRTTQIKFNRVSKAQAKSVIKQLAAIEKFEIPDEETCENMWSDADGSVRDLLNIIESYINNDYKAGGQLNDEVYGPIVKSLATALMNRDWKTVASLLKTEDARKRAESVRLGVCSYLRAVCLNRNHINSVQGAAVPLGLLCGELQGAEVEQYNQFVLRCMRACYKK